jgi:hypothetical protein
MTPNRCLVSTHRLLALKWVAHWEKKKKKEKNTPEAKMPWMQC